MMTMKKFLGLAGLLGMVTVSSGASALTWFIQPVSGRPWNGNVPGQREVGNIYNRTDFTLFDTQVCVNGANIAPTWVTNVQIDLTNATYSAVQDRSRSGVSPGSQTFVKSRLVSFTASGAVSQAPTATDSSTLTSVTVPTNGTLFVQSTMKFVDEPDISADHACLRSLRVTR